MPTDTCIIQNATDATAMASRNAWKSKGQLKKSADNAWKIKGCNLLTMHGKSKILIYRQCMGNQRQCMGNQRSLFAGNAWEIKGPTLLTVHG